MTKALLQGRHILLVEDEYFIADAMQRGLERAGAQVVGPAASVGEALALLESKRVDGAILDVNISDEKIYPVAEALSARCIPFVFATGYGARDLPPEWRHVPRCEKPVDVEAVGRVLLLSSAT